MDPFVIFVFAVIFAVVIFLILLGHENEDLHKTILEIVRKVDGLYATEKVGPGYTGHMHEVQLVNGQICVMYTPRYREDGAFIETAYIRLSRHRSVLITRINGEISQIRGGRTWLRGKKSPGYVRRAVSKVFLAILDAPRVH